MSPFAPRKDVSFAEAKSPLKADIHDARSSSGRACSAGPRNASRTPGARRPRNHRTEMGDAARRGHIRLPACRIIITIMAGIFIVGLILYLVICLSALGN